MKFIKRIVRRLVLLRPKALIMIFPILAKLNKVILPSYSRKDLTKLNSIDKAIIAYRLWVTKKVLK